MHFKIIAGLRDGLRAMEEALIKIPITDLIPSFIPNKTFKIHQASLTFIPDSKVKYKCIQQEICVGNNIVLLLKITINQWLYELVMKYFQWQCTIKKKTSLSKFTTCHWNYSFPPKHNNRSEKPLTILRTMIIWRKPPETR